MPKRQIAEASCHSKNYFSGKKTKTNSPQKEYIDLIKNAKNIVCLVGAGISVSCGIPDFRSAGGIYSLVEELNLNLSDPQEVFDIEYFTNVSPAPFYKIMYKMLVDTDMKKDKLPSITHKFLAKLDENKRLLPCYTQNIDGLEEEAGIKKKSIKYCHGSFSSGAKCLNSKKCNFKIKSREQFIEQLILANNNNRNTSSSVNAGYGGVPMCLKCHQYPLKPGITFFGEKIESNITNSLTLDQKKADLLLVLGTSLKVSPMKNIINYFNNIPHILINKQHVSVKNSTKTFDYELIGNADDIINHIREELNGIVDSNNNGNKSNNNECNDLPSNIYCFEGCNVSELKKALLPAGEVNNNKNVAIVETISCDICTNEICTDLDGFSCKKCFGFDICKTCYEDNVNLDKHKEIFGIDHDFGALAM